MKNPDLLVRLGMTTFEVHDERSKAPTLCLVYEDGSCDVVAEFNGDRATEYAEICARALNEDTHAKRAKK